MKDIIVIVGPTGVGKTKLSVELAKKYDGEIISGDSMQVYRGMDIGTAKVTPEETQGIKHYNIDIKDPKDNYSVANFQNDVRKQIEIIKDKGKLPIIVGGTGLYIKSVLYDYEFEESNIQTEFYKDKYKDKTNEELYDYLRSIDLESANNIHPNNRQRVIRAIAIYESTGIKKSETLSKQEHKPVYDAYIIGLTLPRDKLYARINERVDTMLDEGLILEIKKLLDLGLNRNNQSMKAIGYKEWFDYLEGKTSLEETIELIKQHSRNYAKRQYTWFNNQMDVNWYNVNLDDFNKTILEIENDLNK
ncbi:MAG: tRNA (adenosine(37)-N6)-dimethylallyltransferase MiaA [Thomasclavelia sp.]|nr:tRNA (adenosine(37)-N6)-dimethylallyltransferase MiaA [Thomasclavelia sp.]